jgi:hypothetical protein
MVQNTAPAQMARKIRWAFLFGSLLLVTGHGPTAVMAQPTATGKHLKIISITRAKEYPPPPHSVLKAKAGSVFIAVAFVPVPLKAIDDYPDMRDAVLVDSLGNKYSSIYVDLVGGQTINGKSVPEYECFVFPMKEGAKPQEMLVKGLKTDLAKTPVR